MLDISYWNSRGPEIEYSTTRKKFYRKFLLRGVFEIEGIGNWAIRNNSSLRVKTYDDFQGRLKKHLCIWDSVSFNKETGFIHCNINGYGVARDYTKSIDSFRLWRVLQFKQKYIKVGESKQNKVRLMFNGGKNQISIYTNDEDILKEFSELVQVDPKTTIQLHYPDSANFDAINDGKTLSIMAKDFNYKLMLTDLIKTEHQKRLDLLGYLEELEGINEVKVPDFVKMHLNAKKLMPKWLHPQLYIYCNDKNIESFLQMLIPNCVRSFNPLVLPVKPY